MLDTNKIQALLDRCEKIGNLTIFDSFVKAYPKIDTKQRIVCCVSGGSDSDIMLDLLTKIDTEKKIKYVFFDTGIEYEATKKHLDYLESEYGIKIEKQKAIKPVPLGCRQYGVPFWSKYVSEMIERLQRHGFKWEDKPYDELIQEYPKCQVALKWWCNSNEKVNGKESRFNIAHVMGLKEYMILNPPTFKISNKCCKGAKKDNAKKYLQENNADLHILGIRKNEGGIRDTQYKNCFTPAKTDSAETWDNYRPIFWYTDKDKRDYEVGFLVLHSDCYRKYGLIRTGCAGCPFGKRFEEELEICKKYEPKLYKAIINIFGKSYEYTRGFLEFRKQQEVKM